MILTELQKKILDLKSKSNLSNNKIAKTLDCNPSTVSRTLKKYNDEIAVISEDYNEEEEYLLSKIENINKNLENDEPYIEFNTYNPDVIRSIPELLKATSIDLAKWKVAESPKPVVNSWTVTMKNPADIWNPIQRTNYQIKIYLEAKVIENSLSQSIDKLIKKLPTNLISPGLNRQNNVDVNDELAGELSICDAHFGMYAYSKETLMGDWDLDTAYNAYIEVSRLNIEQLRKQNLKRIFYVIGNDLLHFETIYAKTTRSGNFLDGDNRITKIIDVTFQAILDVLLMLREICPNVEVIWVPGNHDETLSYTIVKMIDCMFKLDKHISVNIKHALNKCIVWGDTFIGLSHNMLNVPKTYNSLMVMFPQEYALAKHREGHFGHLHNRKIIKMDTIINNPVMDKEFKMTHKMDTIGGATFRQLPSLAPPDHWHADSKWVGGIPGGDSFIISSKRGIIQHNTFNLDLNK